MKASFQCWECAKLGKKRIDFEDLVEEKHDKNHWDYNCPVCGKVIICSEKRIS